MAVVFWDVRLLVEGLVVFGDSSGTLVDPVSKK